MKEYKIVLERCISDLEEKLNNYAAEGWKVIFFSQGKEEDLFGHYQKFMVVFEREKE